MSTSNASQAQSVYGATGGTISTASLLPIVMDRNPGVADIYSENGMYQVGQRWVNNTTSDEFYLESFISTTGVVQAHWIQLASTVSGVTALHDAGAGIALPVAGAIDIIGSVPMTTLAAGNSVTISVGNASTIARGVIQIATNAETLTGADTTKAVTPDDLTAKLGAQTVHGVMIGGGGAGQPLSVTAAGTAGQPLLSGGGGANPVWGRLTVPFGGTDNTTFTAYAPVCGGTAATNPFQSAATGIANVGFVLTSNGNAALPDWQVLPAATKIGKVMRKMFFNTGVYTPAIDTPGMTYCDIEIVGGGGGGGGGDIASVYSGGGGGGYGEYARGVFLAATIGALQAITIGAGGIGNLGAAGGNGGTTSVGALLTAFPGLGGAIASTGGGLVIVSGGVGGTGGAGGDLRFAGAHGNWGNVEGFGATAVPTFSGAGANGVLGSGGLGIVYTVGNGTAASGYGAGGGGGYSIQPGVSKIGGAGFKGLVIITAYCT